LKNLEETIRSGSPEHVDLPEMTRLFLGYFRKEVARSFGGDGGDGLQGATACATDRQWAFAFGDYLGEGEVILVYEYSINDYLLTQLSFA
jgi:hypothetical protein